MKKEIYNMKIEYNPTNIYTENELKKKARSSVINGDIIIRGEQVKEITNIKKINGSFGISDSAVEFLGNLIEVTGDFWISIRTVFSPLKSLGNLEKIGGDANFRYSNICELGNLEHVGGKLSLRDTSITTLSNLQFVGGDLYLPKRLQGSIDLSNIYVAGKVKYWNDSKSRKTVLRPTLNLKKAEDPIPYWGKQYIYSKDDLSSANRKQKQFYHHFKNSFLNNVFLDIEGNCNYLFVLFHDLINDYYQHKDIGILETQFKNLEENYPKIGGYTSWSLIDELEHKQDHNRAWELTKTQEYVSIQSVWKYQQKINASVLDGSLIVKLAGYSHLTYFGQDNIELIKPFAEKHLRTYEKENNSSFFHLFFDNGRFFKSVSTNSEYSAEYYKKFYLVESEYLYYKEIDDTQMTLQNKNTVKHVINHAILNQLKLILREAENKYREEIGMPRIGEGWIRETELYYKIKERFKEYEVIHHGKPTWLGKQHLDIYIPEFNIGIEYQGAQHYKPIDYFGGEEAFRKNQERDRRKRVLCETNDCYLIIVNEKYDLNLVLSKIEEKILYRQTSMINTLLSI